MATAPVFYTTQRAAMATISSANTNRDGSGTLGTVFTAGASGSKIERIIAQATGNTTAGMVRLYIHDGSSAKLVDEILVTAITVGAGTRAFREERDCSQPGSLMILPTGYSLRASTHNAESFNVIAIGADA